MKPYHIFAIIIAVIAVIWIGSGFIFPSDSMDDNVQTISEASDQSDKPFRVRVSTIQAQDYTDDVIVTGRSQASKQVMLKAEIPGQINDILKEEGVRVQKGDVLAVIEVQERGARVKEAEQRVAQRQIEYNAAKGLEREGFGSKVRSSQARGDLENARAVLKDAQMALKNTKIVAPMDGTLSVQSIEAGDYVSVGDSVFTVVNLDPIEFAGFVSEKRIGAIKHGQKAVAEILNGDAIETNVSYIAPAAAPQTRTFRVLLSAPNTDRDIKEGLTAKIRIPASQTKAYKISPSILSLSDDGTIGVKIVDTDNQVVFKAINILADTPEAMWVNGVNGSLSGDVRFITVGQEFVASGQTVEPSESNAEGLL